MIYELTDGREVFNTREMSKHDAQVANNIAHDHTDGVLYWRPIAQLRVIKNDVTKDAERAYYDDRPPF